MLDLIKTIDNFSGENDPSIAKQWLQQVETKNRLHSWPDAFTFETARTHLTRAAKYWYQAHIEDIQSWASFRTAFKKTFIFEKSKADQWKEMQDRVQEKDEGVSTYFHEKVKLCKCLGLDFEEIKQQISIGLISKDLSDFILTKCYSDENELYKNLIMKERINYARRSRAAERSDRNKVKGKFEEKRYPVRKEEQKTKPNSKVLRCYNCNKEGHVKINCTKAARERGSCYECGAIGHQKRDCPRLRQSTSTQLTTN